uniref:Terpene synthase N-terminal domain-containing protein n=1 Tax=Fagus sylvatica TaxID=28930 RepID=A0A2N9HVV0_FAGSY
MMLDKVVDPANQLELIDILQKLGLSYHFEDEINKLLKSIYNNVSNNDTWDKEGLYAAALKFRLLRQHGYNVSQELFSSFKDEFGNFKAHLCEDTKGMLYLYEASYLLVEVSHSLEIPLHWRMPRLEARWFIDIYARSEGMNPTLLELAKLDFNMVQATHQEDLRDVLMRMCTRICVIITIIDDDVYDVYGTLDELELFTDVIERWEINAMEQLPDYMKICFLILYNTVNEIALNAHKEQGFVIISYLKKVWADLCKSFLVEAKWYYSGYTPSLQEYNSNAWISIAGPVVLVHKQDIFWKE